MRILIEVDYNTRFMSEPLDPAQIAGFVSAIDGMFLCKRDGYSDDKPYLLADKEGRQEFLSVTLIDDFDHRVPAETLKSRAIKVMRGKPVPKTRRKKDAVETASYDIQVSA